MFRRLRRTWGGADVQSQLGLAEEGAGQGDDGTDILLWVRGVTLLKDDKARTVSGSAEYLVGCLA